MNVLLRPKIYDQTLNNSFINSNECFRGLLRKIARLILLTCIKFTSTWSASSEVCNSTPNPYSLCWERQGKRKQLGSSVSILFRVSNLYPPMWRHVGRYNVSVGFASGIVMKLDRSRRARGFERIDLHRGEPPTKMKFSVNGRSSQVNYCRAREPVELCGNRYRYLLIVARVSQWAAFYPIRKSRGVDDSFCNFLRAT